MSGKSEEIVQKFLDFCKQCCSAGTDIADIFNNRFNITNPYYINSESFRNHIINLMDYKFIESYEYIDKFIEFLSLLKNYQNLPIDNYKKKYTGNFFETFITSYEDMEVKLIKKAFFSANTKNLLTDNNKTNLTCCVKLNCINVNDRIKLINVNSLPISDTIVDKKISSTKNINISPLEETDSQKAITLDNTTADDINKSSIVQENNLFNLNSIALNQNNNIIQSTRRQEHIKKLEILLWKLNKRIRKMEAKELSLDEMNDESHYILCNKYKGKCVKVWTKLRELQRQPTTTDRIADRKFIYTGSSYAKINSTISEFVNKSKVCLDFQDVFDIVTKCNDAYNLQIKKWSLHTVSERIFVEVCEMLKKKRISDYKQNFGTHLTDNFRLEDDPAKTNAILAKKLMSNKCRGDENMQKVFERFVHIQNSSKSTEEDEGGETASDEVSDADSRISEQCEVLVENVDNEMLCLKNEDTDKSDDENDDSDNDGDEEVSYNANYTSENENSIEVINSAESESNILNISNNKFENDIILDARRNLQLTDKAIQKSEPLSTFAEIKDVSQATTVIGFDENSNADELEVLESSILGYISDKYKDDYHIGELVLKNVSSSKNINNNQANTCQDSYKQSNSKILCNDIISNDDNDIFIIEVNSSNTSKIDNVEKGENLQNNQELNSQRESKIENIVTSQRTHSDELSVNLIESSGDEVCEALILDSPKMRQERKKKERQSFNEQNHLITREQEQTIAHAVKLLFEEGEIYPVKNVSRHTLQTSQRLGNEHSSISQINGSAYSHTNDAFDQYDDITSTNDCLFHENFANNNNMLIRADYIENKCDQRAGFHKTKQVQNYIQKTNKFKFVNTNSKTLTRIRNTFPSNAMNIRNTNTDISMPPFFHPLKTRHQMNNTGNYTKNICKTNNSLSINNILKQRILLDKQNKQTFNQFTIEKKTNNYLKEKLNRNRLTTTSNLTKPRIHLIKRRPNRESKECHETGKRLVLHGSTSVSHQPVKELQNTHIHLSPKNDTQDCLIQNSTRHIANPLKIQHFVVID